MSVGQYRAEMGTALRLLHAPASASAKPSSWRQVNHAVDAKEDAKVLQGTHIKAYIFICAAASHFDGLDRRLAVLRAQGGRGGGVRR